MEDHVDHVVLMRYGMEKDVSVMRASTRSLVFVVHVIQTHHTMDSIVCVIMVTMEIEIYARNAMNHVENVQDLVQASARLVLISAIDLRVDFVQGTVHAHLVSTWMVLNVRNVLITVMNVKTCLHVMYVLMVS